MSTLYVEVTFAVAIDVGDHYEGVTAVEQALSASVDADLSEWLTNEMHCVEFVGAEVVTDGDQMDAYRDCTTRPFRITLSDGVTAPTADVRPETGDGGGSL